MPTAIRGYLERKRLWLDFDYDMNVSPSISTPPQQAHAASQSGSRTIFWVGLVLLVALLQRAVLWFQYQAVAYSDTKAYRRLADAILGGWDRYDGTRTPGYPFFLALVGPDERVWLAQMFLGVITTLLFFYLGWQLSRKAWFGAVVALAHTFNLGQLFFEANLLTESLTTFCVALATAGIFYWLYHLERRNIGVAVLIGLASSLALIIRPLFIYYPFWLLLFLPLPFGWAKQNKSRLIAYTLACLAPVALIAGGWVGYLHNRFGDWGMNTMSGYHLMQHTGVFFEVAPDEYAELRDTYLEYREQQIAEHGSQANTIWRAIPEMQEVSGLTFYDLSRTLSRISWQMIREHPDLYLRNVVKGWWYFWRVPFYWSAESLAQPALAGLLRVLVLAERLALFGVNMLFLSTSVLALVWSRFRQALALSPALWCLAGSIWEASVVQTLVDHGDNPRFLVPMQSLVVLWVLWVGYQLLSQWKAGRREAVEAKLDA